MNWFPSLLKWLATGSPARLLVVTLAMSLPLFAGCGGCTSDPSTATNTPKPGEDPKKKKKDKDKEEKPKPNFEIPNPDRIDIHPADNSPVPSGVKRGHWSTASRPLRANNFDFQGSLESYLSTRTAALQPYEIDDTRHRLTLERPAVLPKGQWKQLEMMYFIPRNLPPPETGLPTLPEGDFGTRYAWLWHRLESRTGGLDVPPWFQQVQVLESWQYFFVVLADAPEKYNYVKNLESIRMQTGGLESQATASVTYYMVVSPKIDQRIPVPSHPMAWTSTAFLLWDDADPNLLTTEQRESMIDWLHWGGQLLISGPDSLAALQQSFLAEYLPAKSGDRFKLTADRIQELNEKWSIPEPGHPHRTLKFVEGKEPEGIELQLLGDGQHIAGTGKLVAERQIGRGRIAVTSFSLGLPALKNWGHIDGFYNGCLLRRPSRVFEFDTQEVAAFYKWNGANAPRRRDARVVTTLRYFSRDFQGAHLSQQAQSPRFRWEFFDGQPIPEHWNQQQIQTAEGRGEIRRVAITPEHPETMADGRAEELRAKIDGPAWASLGWQADGMSGVAGWSDASAVAENSRKAIQDAAGIQVPPPSFVLRLLAIYLVVLVPVNWLFFRLIGRVEWAWMAAPVIAIAGAVTVIRMAQLDIGFARSRTEVGFLEVQAGHPRAHLSRFMALYTSLSTAYELDFASNSAVALPLAAKHRANDRTRERIDSVALRRESEAQLRGFQVSSNSTGLVHSEEMFDLNGGFEIKRAGEDTVVSNGSRLNLDSAAAIRRTLTGEIEVAWIGSLAAKGEHKLRWKKLEDPGQIFAQWEQSPVTAKERASNELSLRGLIDLAQDPRSLAPGDTRLIGWTGEELPGVTFQPAASQNLYRTAVVVHLARAPFAAPQVDVNTRLMVDRPKERPGGPPEM